LFLIVAAKNSKNRGARHQNAVAGRDDHGVGLDGDDGLAHAG
jgi:hypothetical protein